MCNGHVNFHSFSVNAYMENFKSKSANRLFIKTLAVAFLKRTENFALLQPAANCHRHVSPTETPLILIGHLISESCQKDVKILSKTFFE